jgi:hypothetical protein
MRKLAAAVDAIRAGQVTKHPDGHLLLPEGLEWPCASNNVLFVRKYYAPLFESVLKGCAEPAPADLQLNDDCRIVTGQPGIGKSVFG